MADVMSEFKSLLSQVGVCTSTNGLLTIKNM